MRTGGAVAGCGPLRAGRRSRSSVQHLAIRVPSGWRRQPQQTLQAHASANMSHGRFTKTLGVIPRDYTTDATDVVVPLQLPLASDEMGPVTVRLKPGVSM